MFLALLPQMAQATQNRDLKKVESELAQEKKRQADLLVQQRDIQNKLDRLRRELVDMAKEVQLREQTLVKLTSRQQEIETKITTEKDKLAQQRQSLAHVLMALQRLSRMPAQAMMLRPSRPIDTARTYQVLGEVIPQVQANASALKETLQRLDQLQATLVKQKKVVKTEQADLTKRQARLQRSVDQRQALLRQTKNSTEKTAQKVTQLARQARDLRELLSGIQKAIPTPPVVTGWKDKVSAWFNSRGSALPVAGRVKTGYGQPIAGGDKSQGLTIEAMPASIVVSPGAGTVRFAGPFRQYKLLVIIQHANGEHSLLGGLQEIYARVGDTVIAGEPIGKLSGKLSGDRQSMASLYYERRRNGKPIDPRQARG